MSDSFLRRVLSPVVTFREGEATTSVLMFLYSFLVMTAYNSIKPSAASKFIEDLGAENVPYAFLIAGVSMGFILNFYSRGVSKVPKLWVLPGTQIVLVALLVSFWFLFQTGQPWVSAAFFFFGRLLLGIFLISQFWTLANEIYDPRQAKRVFGFIGGGATLGGMTGSVLTRVLVEQLGTDNLILVSAGILALCFFLILEIQRRSKPAEDEAFQTKASVGGGEALTMLRQSKHLQLIALIIGFGALGAATLEQQLYMASAAEVVGTDAITSFLAGIQFYISVIGFIIQVYFTSRIFSVLGIGFALAILPVSLGATAFIVILNKALWASGVARVSDSALRYSVDKTTRETLFLPLPAELKLKAKAFVDVVADRFIGKGIGSVVLLVAINVFDFTWWQLSYLSLGYCALWFALTRRAKREYIAVFRRSIETLSLEPERLSPQSGDLATVETLVEELGSSDEQRVLRSIELLEALEKRNLITPLLLRHASPRVRSRTLGAIQGARTELVERWLPSVELSLKDDDPDVRAAAVEVIASVRSGNVLDLMRPYLRESDPRIVATAAVALAESSDELDRTAAEETLERLASDGRESATTARREAARAIARTSDPRFRQLLTPLMNDSDVSVAREAIRSARLLGDTDLLFVPVLVSLLRDRRLKNTARDVLVSYGEDVIPTLIYFLNDDEEDPWVRRHIPGTLALIPSQLSVAELLGCLGADDGFIRYKAIKALERMRREPTELALTLDPEPIQALLEKEVRRYYRYLGSTYDLFDKGNLSRNTLLAQALEEKRDRAMDRIYRLMGLLYDGSDIRAARWAIEYGDALARSSGIEFLDNTLSGEVRKLLLPLVDDVPLEEKVRKGNVLLKTRVRGVEEALTRLIYDEDEVIAATAIDMVREQKMWLLADDLEQVLAFRDAKDFAVFEAASYALAAHHHEMESHAV
ncbi:MAG: hypothetical protein BMS9Abin37_1261 [Acidobacteriota bacterium]|nr:MAG: hypothetical protein BMS9Abin37_1261 [Acidobacteriota bacterium]